MPANNLPYFKFVSALVDRGVWAELSPAARTLYPVLLRFSDGNFKPVYPGTNTLLKLTGFKHKASLRRARQELVKKGLVTISLGSGRQNSYYQFRFDFCSQQSEGTQGGAGRSLWGSYKTPAGRQKERGQAGRGRQQRGSEREPPYNKIHISINNQPTGMEGEEKSTRGREFSEQKEEEWKMFLSDSFGKEALDLAVSECKLSGIEPNAENLEKILYRSGQYSELSWSEVEKYLSRHISPASVELIGKAYIKDQDGLFLFRDILPVHLKRLLERLCGRILFEQNFIAEATADFSQSSQGQKKKSRAEKTKNRLLQSDPK